MKRNMCRFLIMLAVWAPYQMANAGMIATDQSVHLKMLGGRAALNAFVARAEVASELQALGIDAAKVKERIAAMTDAEANTLAGDIASAPAGGVYTEGLVFIIVLAIVIWAIYKERNPWP
jgi:hypothetical protein